MQEGDLNTVYQAIHALYNGVDTQHAQEWLNNFRSSLEAWTLCDQILSQRLDPLACYFASQTLKTKIAKHLKELPEDTYLSLRQSLINHLGFFGAASHDQHAEATSTQLCLCIADLYIQVPQWNNWIAELLNQFTTQHGDRTAMLLTLLRVFPEEINEVKVGENRRRQIRDELAINASSVFIYLTHVLQQCHNNADMLKRVLVCLSAYLQNPVLSTDEFATSPLLMSVFQIVGAADMLSSLHEAASDVIVSALLRAEDQGAHLALAKSLQKNIYHLAEPFNKAVENEDLDKLNNYARIFVELNESLVEPLVNKTSDDINELGSLYSMDLLLLVAGHHDYSLIEMTFNVWYRISEALFMIDDQDHVARFKPYVNRFLMCLYRHCHLDLDESSLPDSSSEFAEFRIKAVEAIRDVVFIVGTNECIQRMYDVLRSASQWNETEAALFIIATVINNLMPEEDGMVPELVTSIVSLGTNSHPALIATSIHLLGGCNEWLEKHRTYLEQVMPWLLRFTGSPLYCQMAAESVEKIVSFSASELVSLIQPLMHLIPSLQATTANGTQIEAAISSLLKACSTLIVHLRPEEMKMAFEELCKPIIENLHRILHHDAPGGVPSILPSLLTSKSPAAAADKSLKTPSDPFAIIGGPAPPPASSGSLSSADKENDKSTGSWAKLANEPILWVDRVASIFREVCKPQSLSIVNTSTEAMQRAPWMDVAHHLYEILSMTLKKYDGNYRIVEHCCRSIRFLIRSLGIQSLGFVNQLVPLMKDIYSRHKHSCFLYLASILVDEYGAIETVRLGLLDMLESLASGTFPLLFSPDGFRNHPDTVDDLFRLATRFTTRAPSIFFAHPIARALFECGLQCLYLDHIDANRQVTKFFIEIIEQLLAAQKANYVDEGVREAERLVMDMGATMVEKALHAALFKVSGSLRRDMAEIIQLSGRIDRVKQREWLVAACASLPRGPLCATEEQLKQFVDNVANDRDNSIRSVFQQLRDLIQLYE